MSILIDSTLDELDQQVRELKRDLTMIETLRRRLSPGDNPPASRLGAGPASSPRA
jgi:hypothetical protein